MNFKKNLNSELIKQLILEIIIIIIYTYKI